MMKTNSDTKITVCCPSGHRVRGDISFAGNTVRCPKCHTEFVFAPLKASTEDSPAVTDTGVMRILGETPQLPPSPEKKVPTLKSCARCGVSISANSTVCGHCNCYVGVMPRFMEQLFPDDSSVSN